ncbi:MAG: hypothetical protein WCJ69_11290 [Betaproteobacteria bacterium]
MALAQPSISPIASNRAVAASTMPVGHAFQKSRRDRRTSGR